MRPHGSLRGRHQGSEGRWKAMRALSSRTFCPCKGRQVGLLHLPARWRYTTASTPLRLFVWLSGVRWAIEQGFEETKTELGMAHYELRKYTGWHHHMLTGMLAHFFLWHLKMRWGKKSASAHGVAGETRAGEGAPLANLYPGGGPPFGAMDTAAQSCGVSVASQKAADRRLMHDQWTC